MTEDTGIRDRLRSSTSLGEPSEPALKPRLGAESEAVAGEARLTRLGHRPTARRSMLELPEELPLSAGTVNFMSFAMAIAALMTCFENYFRTGEFLEFETFRWFMTNFHIGLGFWVLMVVWSYAVFLVTATTIRKILPIVAGSVLYAFLQMFLFSTVTGLMFAVELSPLMRTATAMQICVHTMKAHSYWATNFTYRDALAFAKSPDLSDHDLRNFPDNLNIKTFSYFLFAPTLTYEPEYPRTPRINWKNVVEYSTMFLLAALATYIMLINYLMPAWEQCNIEHPNGFGQAFRTLMKLSLPTMAMWMLMFFTVFHCFLNLSAELLRFADREFYQDWWNATSFDVWWRKWNRPVHKWMLRHIYHDWMHVAKGSRPMATFVTFLVSALLHEFVLAIGLGMFRPILSITMLLQIGLIWFSKQTIFKGTQVGNLIMWMTVFIGQPLVELAYCYEYNRVNTRA